MLVFELHPQRMPDIGADRRIDVLYRDAAAVCRVVKRNVVFKRVGARHVIIVAVLPTPDYTAGLVFPVTLRLELDLDEAVGARSAFLHAPRKGAGARLTKHVRPAGRRAIRLHGPARTALTGHTALPTRAYGARLVLVEILRFGEGGARRQDRDCGHDGSFNVGIFLFNDTATTEIYTLSLHDALPISD